MTRLGFEIDVTRCTGCATCQVACKDLHDSPVGVNYRRVSSFETGVFPAPQAYHFSVSCNHCSNPACVANCPTGAMYISDDGTVQHDDGACIGCETCVENCPYGAPQYVAELEIVQKCDSCATYRKQGLNPVCVDACRNRCLTFVERDDFAADEELVKDISILPPSEKTNPSLLIRAKECCFDERYVEVRM